jgi:hypothetical protein
MPGPAHQALVAYIEDALGQSIEEAYPTEWAAALGGEEQTINIDLGDDKLQITLGTCFEDQELALGGKYHYDIESKDFQHADQTQAWTTGTDALGTAYATSPGESFEVHMGQGQYTAGGQVKAWRKNPRRVVDIDPITVIVPSFPSAFNPVRATLAFTASFPRLGEAMRFYDANVDFDEILGGTSPGDDVMVSELGPPVSFGILLRSDDEIADGHPLTDWWFDLDDDDPLPVDNVVLRDSAQGEFGRVYNGLSMSSTASELDAAFDDFHDDIVTNLSTNTAYTDPVGLTHTLTTDPSFRGWACLYWWHPSEDFYWKVRNVNGIQQTSGDPFPTNIAGGTGPVGQGHWPLTTYANHILNIKYVVPPGPPDETVEYVYPGETRFATQPGLLDGTPYVLTRREPSVLGRGPWVRIAPGQLCITDATCQIPGQTGSGRTCSPELNQLVNALNANPSQETRQPLVDYIEDELGESLEEAYPTEWEAAETGEEQDITIDLGDDRLRITLDQCIFSCTDLQTYHFEFPQLEFDLSTVYTDTIPFSGSLDYSHTIKPDITVEIQQPEFTYLEIPRSTSQGLDAADAGLYESLLAKNHGHIGDGGAPVAPQIGDYLYVPYLKVKGVWRSKIAKTTEHHTGANTHRYRYYVQKPLMGFGYYYRFESPVSGFPRDPDDPFYFGGFDNPASPHVSANDSELPNSSSLPAVSSTGKGGTTPLDYSFPDIAYGPNPTYGLNNKRMSEFFSGFTASDTTAYDEIIGKIEDYIEFATGPYDPVVTIDEGAGEIVVSQETDDNCLYIALPVCGKYLLPSQPESNRYPFFGISCSWGGWWLEENASVPIAGYVWSTDYRDMMDPPFTGSYPSPARFEGLEFKTPPFNGVRGLNNLAIRHIYDHAQDTSKGYFTTDYERQHYSGPTACLTGARCIW